MDQRVTVVNLSGVYREQDFFRDREHIFLDLEDIAGTSCYCDDAAKPEIDARLAGSMAYQTSVHFIDSGNYHYLTLFFLHQIRKDFALVLFDNHPDMQAPSFGEVTSCGGWVREALLTLPHLRRVYVYGNEAQLLREVAPLDGRVCVVFSWEDVAEADGEDDPENSLDQESTDRGQKMAAALRDERLPLYISVDKDLLRTDDATCNWSQGVTTEEQLREELAACLAHRVLGVDLCGEAGGAEDTAGQARNNRLNRSLLNLLADHFIRIS